MPALNRRNRTVPEVAGHYLYRLAGDELNGRAMRPCILIAPPNPVLSLMAGAPDAEDVTGNRRPQRASGRDHSGIWLRHAATGLCLLAAAAAVASFTAQYRLVYATRSWRWWPGWRPRSPMPPRWCSLAWGSRW